MHFSTVVVLVLVAAVSAADKYGELILRQTELCRDSVNSDKRHVQSLRSGQFSCERQLSEVVQQAQEQADILGQIYGEQLYCDRKKWAKDRGLWMSTNSDEITNCMMQWAKYHFERSVYRDKLSACQHNVQLAAKNYKSLKKAVANAVNKYDDCIRTA